MAKSRRRSEPEGRLGRIIVPGLLLVAGYYAVFGGEYSLFDLQAAHEDIASEQAELTKVRAEIQGLEAVRDSLQTDPTMIERVAREEFGMIREGETLYRFADPDAAGPNERTPAR